MPSTDAPTAEPKHATTRPLQAVAILSALYFLARFTGLLQSAVISALLPTTATDAYSAAFDLPDFLNYMVAGGALSSTFIPIFTRFWDRNREADAWRFFSTLASVMGTVIIVLTALMMLGARELTLLTKPGLGAPDKAETLALTVSMTRIILPAQLFFYVGGLLVGVLNTFKRFSASGWTGATYNLVAVAVAVPLFYLTRDPMMFAWGILLGAFVGNFMLPLLAASQGPRAQRPRFRYRFVPDDPAVRRFFIMALPIMFGVSLPVVDQWVVGFFASSMDSGTLTHLRNGNRLMIAVQGVVGQAAAVAAFPYLASQGARGEYRQFADFVRTGLRRLLVVTLPLSILMGLCSRPIVSLVFGWGEYNQAAKIQETALAFAYFCLGLCAWAGQGFVARGFYALGDTRTPTIIGSILTFLVFVPACWLAVRFSDGVVGLALATTLGALAHFVCVTVALDKRMRQKRFNAPIRLEKVGGTALRTLAACAVMALVGGVAHKLAVPVMAPNKLGDIGTLLWTGGISCAAFGFAATRFAIPEWLWIRDKVTSKLKRG